ncbi:hypothetical protein BKA00_006997 [Actinomadura coerulea]|uniref:DUF4287 domain-containing protein n=2 Tax=Actinomadura TaxID=1988 RepID=A0A7X0L2W6_9ACTN|nr:hypothetical protein [Actinomadura coerulea]
MQSRQEEPRDLEVPMSLNHSPETHSKLIARIPQVTGRDIPEWFTTIENGPSFTRCEERSTWLAEEHNLSHGYAAALVREHERTRRARHY